MSTNCEDLFTGEVTTILVPALRYKPNENEKIDWFDAYCYQPPAVETDLSVTEKFNEAAAMAPLLTFRARDAQVKE